MFGYSENSNVDPRLQRALDELGIKYEIEKNGVFRFDKGLKNGRKQEGRIDSSTVEFQGVEVRKLFSIGLYSEEAFSRDIALALLQDNASSALGAWEVIQLDNGDYIAVFSAHVSAELPPKVLGPVIMSVLEIADHAEHAITGRDVF